MSRWQPDSRGRLQRAALELYAERGFAETTVAAVAERAGLTERTFFRHFADKREVLFANEDALRDLLVAEVLAAAGAGTRGAVEAGLAAVAAALQPRHAELRRRQPIVESHLELQERERMKLASWTVALEGALRERGVAAAEAQLAAAVAVAVLDVAARRWLVGTRAAPPLTRVLEEAVAELTALTATEARP